MIPIIFFLILITGFCVFVSVPTKDYEPERERDVREKRETEERARREKEEALKKTYPYGTDPLGKIIAQIDKDSQRGLKDYLDSIPEEKHYGTMTLNGKTYDTVTWVERPENEVPGDPPSYV